MVPYGNNFAVEYYLNSLFKVTYIVIQKKFYKIYKALLSHFRYLEKSIDLQAIIKLMMTPDPQKRPTVDQLLNHKKIINLLQQRRRWDLGKKVVSWIYLIEKLNFLFKSLFRNNPYAIHAVGHGLNCAI